jgi:hypothetical protein
MLFLSFLLLLTYSLHKKKQPEISPESLIITKRLKMADANVKWSECDANEVFGLWRAMPEKLHTRLGKFVVKLKKMSLPGMRIIFFFALFLIFRF